jgi:hypothetical protein
MDSVEVDRVDRVASVDHSLAVVGELGPVGASVGGRPGVDALDALAGPSAELVCAAAIPVSYGHYRVFVVAPGVGKDDLCPVGRESRCSVVGETERLDALGAVG